ncbi:Gfo/Idh/MocA family protein [Jannaschia sp. W003]|uniref:Gfo/Idh/MocA family protein n=1 Tax=Jannaschia sp. W003 TaxID=2867012 RepID=UPI0021A405A4|nr:Gfo/Idh/MocA family oxidoreductase [Jannaschia sp. W003]UWQ21584.1 Gfo/Idh/MocA family oxidoreductase [Jannaschia sp. W003]
MSGPLRWGIAGAGWIAANFAADLARGHTGHVARVCARRPERAEALAARHGAGTAPDVAALAAAPDVDVVYVATPAALHRDHALAALEAGKPVLCEKPFALSAAEAREVVEAARARGLFCMEAMWTRFLPVMTELRRRVQAGELGPVSQLSADLGFPYAETAATASITAPAHGGGALHDLGIYGVSVAHDLLGPPVEIAAQAIRGPGGGVRDVAVVMRHATVDGTALSSLRASHGTELANALVVAGASGRITVDAPFIAARGARAVRVNAARERPAPVSELRRRLANSPLRGALRRLAGRDGRAIAGPYPGTGLGPQADEVARCLREGCHESPVMPLDETLAVLGTMDRIAALIRVDPAAASSG